MAKKSQFEQIEAIIEQFSQLCFNEEFSDVTFITADGERVPGHRLILATRSDYFKAMLYGGLAETTQREVKVQASGKVFKLVLRYLYSGRFSLDSIEKETLVETLRLAHQYGVECLEAIVEKYLNENLLIENVDDIFIVLQFYREQTFTEKCLKFIDRHAAAVLEHESFLELPREMVCDWLKRDSFFAPEIEIFRFVRKWLEQHPEEKLNAEEITSLVRLPLLTQDQLLDEVVPSGLFEPQKIFDAQSAKRCPEKLAKRYAEYGKTRMEANVASVAFEARVLKGINPMWLFSLPGLGYTEHAVGDSDGIVVALDFYQINHIRMQLYSDKKDEEYPYYKNSSGFYVEISLDHKKWERVVDYSAYICRSWQSLYFETRPVRYIRLVGTGKNGLKVNSFEAKCVQNVPRILNQIIERKENVATPEMGAKVIAVKNYGNNSVDNLLRESWDRVESHYRYVHHYLDAIGSNITIQLAQPYVIGSIKLLLYADADCNYKFKIETSLDGERWELGWEMAVDKRDSWESKEVQYTFQPRPTIFVRIIGTDSNQLREFRCVHFECSA